MITDRENLFSLKQAITADADSTDVIKVNNKMRAATGYLFVQVEDADFNTLTNLAITFRAGASADKSAPRDIYSETPLLAALVIGKRVYCPMPTLTLAEQYVWANYNVGGTDPTTGKLTGGWVEVIPSEPAAIPAGYTGL